MGSFFASLLLPTLPANWDRLMRTFLTDDTKLTDALVNNSPAGAYERLDSKPHIYQSESVGDVPVHSSAAIRPEVYLAIAMCRGRMRRDCD